MRNTTLIFNYLKLFFIIGMIGMMELMIGIYDWNDMLKIQDPDFATELLITKIKMLTERSTVFKNKIYNRRNKARKSWMTNGILNSIKTKEILYLQHSSNPESELFKHN